MGAGGSLRVVLHGEHRKFFVANAFHGSVVEIDVGHLEPLRARHPMLVASDRKPVVL
jgi:hypothetical protein